MAALQEAGFQAGNGDGALVARAAQGDVAAFTALMRRYNQRLFRTARAILHNDSDAEEAVQEAWWKAWQHLAGFRGDAAVSTWLTRIAANEALMRRRRNEARGKVIQSVDATIVEEAGMSLPELPSLQSLVPGPDDQASRAELRRILEAHISALPDKYREVFMLRGVEEMPSAEVAELLGIPEATVRVRYLRARRRLQTGLKGLMDSHAREAFSFAGPRCDRIVAAVHARLAEAGVAGVSALIVDAPPGDDVGGDG
ncbi:MAG: RNA polymerase sigma factor [Castellaniella sp.]